ncbi:DUF4249 domain-containing protein [Dyadobacter jiangsuensis]|uniref:DUF4249 domain-containing protein n=1 Tax=Dyadobacter fermentans TaxID=94254 RepID=UPI001CBD4DBA|nr:DUF4249 domain-containing protein [Dyadobacter fermentans]MBZ1362108.1 DUF4249 domain-containing protein [Dyadobacter fermentans]
MKPLSLVFILAVIVACETVVDNIPEARLPKTASKLVVHSFISPQNAQINVAVSESTPLFPNAGVKDNVIKTALVKISDGVNEITIPFDKASQLYSIDQSKFQIVASKTYSLSVSDGERKVTAHCRIPGGIPVIKSYSLDTTAGGLFTREDTALVLKMNWQDIPKDTNYYRVRALAEIEYSVPDPVTTEKRTRNDFDFSWNEVSGKSEWQSDKNLDGSLFSSPTGKVFMPTLAPVQTSDGTPKPFFSKCRLISVTMMVYNTDVNYFKYHRSLQQRMDTENPFTEPSVIYNNIEGGLGCFGAYNIGKLVYKPD